MRTNNPELWEQREKERFARAKELREETKEFIYSKKDPCLFCGEDEKVCIDFHHIDDNTKSFEVAQAISKYRNFDIIQQEIDKCVCLCANCHRKLHAGLFSLPDKVL